jgi:rhodanese-related sulfurtransferase
MTTARLSERKTMGTLYERATATSSGYRDIDPTSVASAGPGVRVVDVREPHELASDLGHIAGVENVPLASVESASRTWDKEQEVVLVCRSGGRSGRVAAYLASEGFTRVMNMVGGMLSWNAARLPVER